MEPEKMLRTAYHISLSTQHIHRFCNPGPDWASMIREPGLTHQQAILASPKTEFSSQQILSEFQSINQSID